MNEERDFTKIPRKWTAVAVDLSMHCQADFLARCGGKVFEVYLFDANELTYCCSVTPSYCLYSMGLIPETYPEDETVREQLCEELLEGDHDSDVAYMDCVFIDRLGDDRKALVGRLEADADEDAAREVYQGTPSF